MQPALTRFFMASLCGIALVAVTLSFPQNESLDPQRRGAKQRTETKEFEKYGVYQKTAPRAKSGKPRTTRLPLELQKGDRIAFIGATLIERSQDHGFLQSLLHQAHPKHQLVIRNLAWSADEIDLQPRPTNFADLEQHLAHEKVDVIFASYGFNESFAGKTGLDTFKKKLTTYLTNLKSKAFNGNSGPRIVLISPIANEDVKELPAAKRNNANIKMYVEAMRTIAKQQKIGFVDVFEATREAMDDSNTNLTFNGCHLTEEGYALFADLVFRGLFDRTPPKVNANIRKVVQDQNRQFFRRYRPLNTFYYTGGRNKKYGYLDFLPAMRNFDIMVANRDKRIWDLAQGKTVPETIDDSNVPPLPKTTESRGINKWLSAEDERKAFKVDPRFEVNLFAGEEQFPEIAAPIQMRWDSKGRLWVSCSTTYPHVYPGREPNDKIVILEDTDGDGKADKSSVFADKLHIPLSFEFGDGGVYVSEQPHLTFLKDTDGDGKADFRRIVLTGFGTEDSHHSLHDIVWTPDGDLMFRESIFHHTQVETPYGPVRQQDSGWFRFETDKHKLTSFGTYRSTNPWGVTFDDWGQHLASHPVYAEAFHSLDPPYPMVHPRPKGLRAYSGVCGHEFIDWLTFPIRLLGYFIKVRYKPTTRVEIHRWKELPFGYDEEYVGDLLFSTNLSFIPVDVRFGPRGALYICDWYNPVKGHAQYSLRDDRRDRRSGRIWRITAKGKQLQDPPKIAEATVPQLVQLLERREYRVRYWAKRELRERDRHEVKRAVDTWVASLNRKEARFRHHQMEAIWTYRGIRSTNTKLLRELLGCEDSRARAAATHQLRYWHGHIPDAIKLLRKAANDSNGIVRMQAAIAASYIGTREAFDAMLDVFKHPRGGHLDYAIRCALGSRTLKKYAEGNPQVAQLLKSSTGNDEFREPTPSAQQAQFDSQKNLRIVRISCLPERMLYDKEMFSVKPGQPIKLVFTNPDATDHNLIIVKAGALAEVGMAANEMAKDPRNASSDFIPESKKHLILHAARMIGPTRKSRVHVLRFNAPKKPGIYPYVCTFPGHWVIMKGNMVVAKDDATAKKLLAAGKPNVVRKWKTSDFAKFTVRRDETSVMRGMQAFMKANCHQCHAVAGHGVNLGPDLSDVGKRYRGKDLLQQILEPSSKIHEDYQNRSFLLRTGKVVTGVLTKTTRGKYHVTPNLLTPKNVTQLKKRLVKRIIISKSSPMPEGLVNVLTKEEIMDLVSFLEVGYELPKHLKHKHPK
ncbi:MAG: PVC-type heme-binding CxxCH protein [Gemmataceae bacterium]